MDFDTKNTISDHQLLLAWNTVVLNPRGTDKTNLMIQLSVYLPPHWKQASSLQVTAQTDIRVNFAPVSLERLIDSPALAGEFLRVFPLPSSWPAELDVTGDSQQAVDKAADVHAVDLFAKLVDQDRAMFGLRHWQAMHLLVSQSEARSYDGLEHTSLLWVYEGLNQYIGMLLATRAGFNDAAYARDNLARDVAPLTEEPARATTPLVDTATENWVLRSAFNDGWNLLRRGQDQCDEGAFFWLRVDTILREQTRESRSLADFLRSFFGQRDTDSIVVAYSREDVEAALAAICPYDWHGFFEAKVYQVNSKPPTDGLEAAGRRLVYNDRPNTEPFYSDLIPIEVFADQSIGVLVEQDGSIFDVLPDSPAYIAG